MVDPALEPATEKIGQIVQGGIKAVEKNDALVQAILAAFEDASQQEGKALAMQYAQMIHLLEIVEQGKTAPRNAVNSISKKGFKRVEVLAEQPPVVENSTGGRSIKWYFDDPKFNSPMSVTSLWINW